MSDYQHLIYEQRGPVTLITINRPDRMNAIGPQTHSELVDAWDRFRADDTALVGVLTGAGERAFCAGGDVKSAFAGELVDASAAEIAAHDRGEQFNERDHPDRRVDTVPVTPGPARSR
jgi:enoyl-CoA hydratase